MGVLLVLLILLIILAVVSWVFASRYNEHVQMVTANDNRKNNEVLSGFKSSVVKDIADYSFLISEEEKKLAIKYNGGHFHMQPVVLGIDDISNLEIIQNNEVIKSGGIGRAIVGGILAGGVGAIVGASTVKQKEQIKNIGIKFITKDIQNPVVRLELYSVLVAYDYTPNKIYRQLEELIAILEIVKEKDVA